MCMCTGSRAVTARTWRSLEGTLRLAATSDALGHVRLDDGTPFQRRVHEILALEAGQPDRIATEARSFASVSER